MNPKKLSAALKLSLESALQSQETSLAEAVFVLESHKTALMMMAVRPAPQEVKIQPATILPPNPNGNHRG